MDLKRDPICGMSGVIAYDGYGFCSPRCLEVYKQQQSIAPTGASGACALPPRRAWYRDVLIWVMLSAIALASIGYLWPAAQAVSAAYRGYLLRMGWPIALGLLLGGFIDYAIPKEYILKMLARPRKRAIILSTLLGFLASACSHGCLAISMELYRKGASTASVISFLLASPWASLSLTFILLGLFGARAGAIIASALGVAFVTGLVFQKLERRGWVETNPHTTEIPESFSIRKDVASRLRARAWTRDQLSKDLQGVWHGCVPLARMVLGWLQLGLVMSAVLGAVIPHDLFMNWMGPSLRGLLVTVGAATVMEVCSEGTAPIAFELYRHTGALGNAFAFLMAGVVTDYTELGALWTNVGRRAVFWLLVITLPLVLVVGLVLNAYT